MRKIGNIQSFRLSAGRVATAYSAHPLNKPKSVRSGINPFVSVIKKTLNTLYEPKTPINKPNFLTRLLKLAKKASQLTLICLAFDDLTLPYAADLVLI